jgi:hypothetical protein
VQLTYDVRSVHSVTYTRKSGLETPRTKAKLEWLKSVFMYKILNNHTAPNLSLRISFRLNNESDNTYASS